MDGLQAGDPALIGPFRLLGRLGEGGMGRVFLGESPSGRRVAIKVVHPHYANDPEFRRRFAREVAAARKVGDLHTAVVGAGQVFTMALAPDGTILAIGDDNGHIYVWNTTTAKVTATLADPASGGVYSLAFAPNSTTLASGDANGHTYFWNTAAGTKTGSLSDPKAQDVQAVAFSPDGGTLATGDFNGNTYLWHITYR